MEIQRVLNVTILLLNYVTPFLHFLYYFNFLNTFFITIKDSTAAKKSDIGATYIIPSIPS